jgi:hypothetical protein
VRSEESYFSATSSPSRILTATTRGYRSGSALGRSNSTMPERRPFVIPATPSPYQVPRPQFEIKAFRDSVSALQPSFGVIRATTSV